MSSEQGEGNGGIDTPKSVEELNPIKLREQLIGALTTQPYDFSDGYYTDLNVNGTDVKIDSYLIGLSPLYPKGIGAVAEEHKAALNNGGPIQVIFNYTGDEKDSRDREVASYSYIFASPNALDKAYEGAELAALFGITRQQLEALASEGKKTPKEIKDALENKTVDLEKPYIFATTRFNDKTKETIVLDKDTSETAGHFGRLRSLSDALKNRSIKDQPQPKSQKT